MAKANKEDAPQRLPGAEGECISREQQEILEWLRKVKFRKKLLGGVDEVQLWKKLEELYGLYANAIRAERARYDALLNLSVACGDSSPSRGAKPDGANGKTSQSAAQTAPLVGEPRGLHSEPEASSGGSCELASPIRGGGSTAGADGEVTDAAGEGGADGEGKGGGA